MLKETKNGDTQSRLTEKRLALVMTKHAVGRGGESRSLDFNTMFYNPHFDHLDATWVDTKTLKKYACPFVPNKDEYPTDVFHSMGCFFVLGRGLRRFQKEDGTISLPAQIVHHRRHLTLVIRAGRDHHLMMCHITM